MEQKRNAHIIFIRKSGGKRQRRKPAHRRGNDARKENGKALRRIIWLRIRIKGKLLRDISYHSGGH
jgi:hypothetical protein